MGDHAGEWAGLDATTTRAGLEDDRTGRANRSDLDVRLVGDVFAVATKRGIGAVEDGRVAGVLDIVSPLPVGKTA